MTFSLAPCARQNRAARRLMPAVALAIGAAFAAAAHAQADQAPSRVVASVETQLSTEVDSAPIANAAHAALPASDLARNQTQPIALPVRRIDIGSATQALLDLQRASPGARPRPIDGDQAGRSYQRYLKSFETSIPEHYGTGLELQKQ